MLPGCLSAVGGLGALEATEERAKSLGIARVFAHTHTHSHTHTHTNTHTHTHTHMLRT